MPIVEAFSKAYLVNIIGTITGTFTMDRFPDVPCNLVRLKAHSANLGSFFIATDPFNPVGWEMDAGDETSWLAINNLNQLWHGRSSGSADLMDYWVQR